MRMCMVSKSDYCVAALSRVHNKRALGLIMSTAHNTRLHTEIGIGSLGRSDWSTFNATVGRRPNSLWSVQRENSKKGRRKSEKGPGRGESRLLL